MSLPSFQLPTLQGTCTAEVEVLRAGLTGSADSPVQSALSTFMVQLHEEAVAARASLAALASSLEALTDGPHDKARRRELLKERSRLEAVLAEHLAASG